jgi:ribulose-5-phosphate 4-epimerase/fuculose-1-phosphate aldolase
MDMTAARREIARACRVLAHQGLAEDVLGHVSLRVAPGQMLIRCRGPEERGLLFTTPDDVHLIHYSERPAAAPEPPEPADLSLGYAPPSELPIHAAVLAARPDVTAVVHAHPPAVVAADLAGLALRPIIGAYNIPAMRMALAGIPVFPRAVLIRRPELAAQMLAAMGAAPVCVLRGHGVTTTGASIAEAVIRAVNLETLARMTLAAASAGDRPADLPAADIAELPDLGSTLNEGHVWRSYLARLDHDGLAV